jgi:hypothetical protein
VADVTDFQKISEAPVRSAFAESASRLDGLVRSVKAKQTGECSGVHCVTEYRTDAKFSPDEVWAKNFATHGIGPQLDQSFKPVAAFQVLPELSPTPMQAVQKADVSAQTFESAPMAMQLGKSPRGKRSLLRVVLFGNRA